MRRIAAAVVAGIKFYQISGSFCRSATRECDQDRVYHHAAGRGIVLRDWDDFNSPSGRFHLLRRHVRMAFVWLPYLKKHRRHSAISESVFTAPSVHQYDTEDYRHVVRGTAAIGRCLRLRRVKPEHAGMRRWCWMACLIIAATRMRGFDRHNRSTGGVPSPQTRRGTDWYSFFTTGVALDWLVGETRPIRNADWMDLSR